jgi:hypothetical protein
VRFRKSDGVMLERIRVSRGVHTAGKLEYMFHGEERVILIGEERIP